MAVHTNKISTGPISSIAIEHQSTWLQGAAQTLVICVAFGGSLGHGYQYRPSLGKNMDSEMAFNDHTVQSITMAPANSTSYLHQCGPSLQPCPWTSAWLKVVAQTMGIHVAFSGDFRTPIAQTWPQ